MRARRAVARGHAVSATGPTSSPGRLRITSVVDQVHAVLRERILSGELPGGERLRQELLAVELGVSRTPLREALRLLATEGLVELEPNRGARVSMLRFGDMRHAWNARLALEPGAARLAAAAGGDVAPMHTAIAAQREAADDPVRSFAVNRDFHLALAAAAGNPHLVHFAHVLWAPQVGAPIYSLQLGGPGDVLAWADEHEAIAAAVAGGDGGRAEALTRAHIAAWPPRAPAQ
jgi:DNA-binding GntR family transcriptional regulator